jgi:hypothetical protein
MSKLVKGIGKAIKGLVKGVKKIFKKITSSTIGKVLLGAALIYFGGAAFGAWNTPFSSVNGAFVKGATSAVETGTAVASTSTATATTAATAEAAGTVATGLQTAATGAEVAATGSAATQGGTFFGNTIAESVAGETAKNLGGSAAKQTLSAAAQKAGQTGTKSILQTLGGAAKGVGKFAKENPIASVMGLNAIAGATGVDDLDVLEEREKQRKAQLNDAYGKDGEGIAGIDLGLSGGEGELTRKSSGAPVYGQGSLLQRLRQRSKVYNSGG